MGLINNCQDCPISQCNGVYGTQVCEEIKAAYQWALVAAENARAQNSRDYDNPRFNS